MRDYHEYDKVRLGGSDIAALIMVGCGEEDLITKALNFQLEGRV